MDNGNPPSGGQRELLEAQANDLMASVAQIGAREAASRRSEAVTTDKRRTINYFFAPILRTIQDAMGEP
jgi:hypothetical protein